MSASPGRPAIPYGRQWIDEDDIAAVVETLRGDFLTTGPAVAGFEAALRAQCGCAHAVAVGSGTAALHCAYFAAGLGADGELLTSPLTFAATANAALYLGARVRFVDVSRDTGNLDPDAVAAAIGAATRVVAAVDFAGHPADYARLGEAMRGRGAALVADAAHSLGASYRGRRVGTLAAATATSFHPVKPVTTGEGGAVLSEDAGLAARAARFRSHGIVRDPRELERPDGPWSMEQQDLGYNYRLTDLQAALGTAQLRKLARFIARRRAIAAAYLAAWRDLAAIELPAPRAEVEPGWHLFVARVREAGRRRAFFERLRALGLGVQVHYLPVYRHPYYARLGYRDGQCPVAEDWYARGVSLPIFPRMSDEEVQAVIEAVRRAATEVL